MAKKCDFSGYATKNNVVCTDGRTILKDAFKHQDGKRVPLVWEHSHDDPTNVIGHVDLENRSDGVYCYGYFNDTENGQHMKEAVKHGDIESLSIWANRLKQQVNKVVHGVIREVSLVFAGANDGAKIDNLIIQHGDGSSMEDETMAIIYSGEPISHSDEDESSSEKQKTASEIFNTLNDEQKAVVHSMITRAKTLATDPKNDPKKDITHADERTIQDILDTFSDEQMSVLTYMVDKALGDESGTAKHSNLDDKGDNTVKHNVFEGKTSEGESKTWSLDQMKAIISDVNKHGGSLKESFLAHAATYGFDPIDTLFPDAKDVNGGEPVTIQRDTTWVGKVLAKTKHTPFSRIRTRFADITADEARAKGYVTGALKKEEVITLMKRTTTPTTIYKKQKLDRDDMLDITDFDVVAWLKREMRGMLDEELARAILISDGRTVADEDKINELNIRPIAMDDGSVFVHRTQVENNTSYDDIIDEFIRIRKFYKGSGSPDLYIQTDLLTEMLLLKDQFGHRLYKTLQELASVLRVGEIIEVEPMNTAVRTVGEVDYEILGIIVNLKDYTIGADKGGQVGMFDDFDIDYNQYKYLIETRCSGALTMPKSALIIERKPAVVG